MRVGDLISSCVHGFEGQARAGGIELTTEVSDPDAVIRCAPDKIERVMMNLLTNALRHTPSDGAVAVSADGHGRSAESSFASATPAAGSPDDEADQVFDRFFRGDSARDSSRGAGLGLAIAKGLVEAHGGEIRAENRPEGGASFSFTLPAARRLADHQAVGVGREVEQSTIPGDQLRAVAVRRCEDHLIVGVPREPARHQFERRAARSAESSGISTIRGVVSESARSIHAGRRRQATRPRLLRRVASSQAQIAGDADRRRALGDQSGAGDRASSASLVHQSQRVSCRGRSIAGDVVDFVAFHSMSSGAMNSSSLTSCLGGRPQDRVAR